MLSPAIIATLFEEFGGAPVAVAERHCLNARHQGVACHRCADTCPTEAIALRDGRPSLEADACADCGACLHQCPTDVYTQTGSAERLLERTVSGRPEERLGLVCSLNDDPGRTRLPVSAIIQHSRCLAALSSDSLLTSGANGEKTLWLDDGPCASCPVGHVRETIVSTAALTNRLLETFGRDASILVASSGGAELSIELDEVPFGRGDQPQMSRRGLFAALGRSTGRVAVRAVADGVPSATSNGQVPVEQRLPQRIPPSRERLFGQLTKLPQPDAKSVEADQLPVADVRADAGACSACALCARFCPTGALQMRVTDGAAFVLEFRSAICIDCGVCAHACPEDAVTYGRQVAAGALVDVSPQSLVRGALGPCSGCGDATAAGEGPDGPRFCFSCRPTNGPVGPLRDTAGLLDDLARRADGGV